MVSPEINGPELVGFQVSLESAKSEASVSLGSAKSEASVCSRPADEMKQYRDRIANELVRLKEIGIVNWNSSRLLKARRAWGFELSEEMNMMSGEVFLRSPDTWKLELTEDVMDKYKDQLLL